LRGAPPVRIICEIHQLAEYGKKTKNRGVFDMKEKYFYIEAGKARALLSQIKGTEAAKRGVDSRVYLIGEYAVSATQRIKLRNVTTRDDDLAYLDELIQTLMSLREQGVATVPILPETLRHKQASK
jgi:hypothetical protein